MKKIKSNAAFGVISDTHDLLDPLVEEAFRGVDLIIHAGDICNPSILQSLATIAPVVAVRGNSDGGRWAKSLSKSEIITWGEELIYVIHILEEMDIKPTAIDVKVVVSGHLHRPFIKRDNGVLYLNPGSATLPRHNLPPSVALLHLDQGAFEAQIIELTKRVH